MAVTPDGTRAYVTNSGGDTVSVIDTATNTVTATIPVGDSPVGVAVTPDGTRVYVTNADRDTVSVIDTATNTRHRHHPRRRQPRSGWRSPRTAPAPTSPTRLGAHVSVIDTATNTVIATIPVGVAPFGVAVTPDGTRAYVANVGSDTVSVIDTATNTVTATIPVGDSPYGRGGHPGRHPRLRRQPRRRHRVGDRHRHQHRHRHHRRRRLPLAVAFATPGAVPSTDLSVTVADSADPVSQGGTFTYTTTITNNGPDAATGVSLSTTLSGTARTIISAAAPKAHAPSPRRPSPARSARWPTRLGHGDHHGQAHRHRHPDRNLRGHRYRNRPHPGQQHRRRKHHRQHAARRRYRRQFRCSAAPGHPGALPQPTP